LIILIKLIPVMFKVDYKKEILTLQMSLGGGFETTSPVLLRSYIASNVDFLSLTKHEFIDNHWDERTVFRIYRDGQRIRLDDDETLKSGDVVQMIGPVDYLVNLGSMIGQEVDFKLETSDISLETVQIVVTGEKIKNLALKAGQFAPEYGVIILNIFRKGERIPFKSDTKVLPLDVLSVMGTASEIDVVGGHLGYIERESVETDMVTFSFGIAIGIIIGAISITLFGVSLGLGAAGGLLVSGLFIGHRRSIRPTFGRIPESTRWFLMEFGLLIFMAAVGLRAGGSFVDTLLESGVGLIMSGMAVTLVPVVLGYTFGHYILRLNPVLLLGALTGAMTSGASLSIVLQEAKSPLPSLGYSGTYAFSNILLVVAGSLIFLWS